MRRIFYKIKWKENGFDVRYFIQNGTWVTVRYGIITFTGLLLSIAFSREVSKEVYGQYQFILTVISFLSLLSLPGLNLVSLRESVQGNDGALLQAVKKSFQWSFGITAIALGYAFYLLTKGEYDLALALGIGGVIAPFYYAPNNWYVFYEGKKNFYSSSLRIIISQFLLLICLWAALRLEVPLPYLVAIYYAIPALLSIYYFFEVRFAILQISKRAIAQKLDTALGVVFTVQKYIFSLSETLIVFCITFLFGFEMLALFQVANMVVLAMSGFIAALFSLYLPHFIKGKRGLTVRGIGYALLAGFPAVFIFLCFLRFFFTPLYGEAYQESLLLGYSFIGIVFLAPFKTFLVNLYTAQKENGPVITANILAVIFLIVAFGTTHKMGFHNSVVISLYIFQVSFILLLILLRIVWPYKEESGISFWKSVL